MKQLPFGTDGMRKPTTDPLFHKSSLHRLALAIDQWLTSTYKAKNNKLFILNDTRQSCSQIKQHLIDAFITIGCHISDIGVMPTPAGMLLLESHPDYQMAIIISASHNPASDNGIKFFIPTGKLETKQEQAINTIFEQLANIPSISQEQKAFSYKQKAAQIYLNRILSQFPANLLKDRHIILDCANGSSFQIGPNIFTKLGARLTIIGNNPDGMNINEGCGSQDLSKLKALVKKKQCLGIAFDGDADRVSIVTPEGIILDGDDILAMLSTHPNYAAGTTYVGTTMTNGGLDLFLAQHKKKLLRTDVGDKHVARAMRKHNILIGAENSGHIILAEHAYTGDGIYAALRFLETCILTNNWTYTHVKKLAQKLIGIPITHRIPLDSPTSIKIIESHQDLLTDGRIMVRYSGTQSLLRIMVESQTQSQTDRVTKSLSKEFETLLAS